MIDEFNDLIDEIVEFSTLNAHFMIVGLADQRGGGPAAFEILLANADNLAGEHAATSCEIWQ